MHTGMHFYDLQCATMENHWAWVHMTCNHFPRDDISCPLTVNVNKVTAHYLGCARIQFFTLHF